MQNAVLDPRRTADGIVVKPFAEGIAEIEAQLAQQRIKTQQAQDLPGAPRAHVGDFTFAEAGFQNAVQRGLIRLPRGVAPVKIVIDVK